MARESSTPSRGTAQSGRTRETSQGQQRGTSRAGAERERSISTSREGTQQGQGLARRGETSRASVGTWGTSSPFTLMQRMAEDMERFMEEFGLGRSGLRSSLTAGMTPGMAPGLTPRANGTGMGLSTAWSPQVEVRQRGDHIVVRADLPGVKREDVQIDVENDMLTIRGERREERQDEREGFVRSERMYGHFSRTIPLPEGVDPDRCEATFKDGVLEIDIPAPEQSQRRGRRIEIR